MKRINENFLMNLNLLKQILYYYLPLTGKYQCRRFASCSFHEIFFSERKYLLSIYGIILVGNHFIIRNKLSSRLQRLKIYKMCYWSYMKKLSIIRKRSTLRYLLIKPFLLNAKVRVKKSGYQRIWIKLFEFFLISHYHCFWILIV